jgi:cytoskeletal protein RodZ
MAQTTSSSSVDNTSSSSDSSSSERSDLQAAASKAQAKAKAKAKGKAQGGRKTRSPKSATPVVETGGDGGTGGSGAGSSGVVHDPGAREMTLHIETLTDGNRIKLCDVEVNRGTLVWGVMGSI